MSFAVVRIRLRKSVLLPLSSMMRRSHVKFAGAAGRFHVALSVIALPLSIANALPKLGVNPPNGVRFILLPAFKVIDPAATPVALVVAMLSNALLDETSTSV